MAAGITISISGIDSLQRKLNNIKSQKAVRFAVAQATALVESSAKSICPVDTGNLRRSIHMKVEERGREVVGTVFTASEYAPFVEFGTGARGKGSYPYEKRADVSLSYDPNWPGQIAQPFMLPALLMNKNQIGKLIASAVVSTTSGGK